MKKNTRGKQPTTSEAVVSKVTQQQFDPTSRRILALLQDNGRRSLSSIAREIGISEGAVRSRVNHLEKQEHLRFIAVIDPVKVGYMCWAMLGITVTPNASPDKLAIEFSKIDEAIWVGVVGGKYDLMVETWTETPTDLQDFLETYCYGNGKVNSVDTMVGMRIYKWGPIS